MFFNLKKIYTEHLNLSNILFDLFSVLLSSLPKLKLILVRCARYDLILKCFLSIHPFSTTYPTRGHEGGLSQLTKGKGKLHVKRRRNI